MFWVYQTQKMGHLSSQSCFEHYTLYFVLSIESMKTILKNPVKSLFCWEGEVISGDLHAKKPLTEITELIAPFYSTEQKLSKQD